MRLNKSNAPYFAVGFSILLLLIYTGIRAAILSMTHDEALVYLLSKTSSYSDIFFYRILPQDHMMNTLLMRLFSDLFNPSAFFLRLPNLAGHVLFLVFSFLILKKTTSKALLPAAFILLNFNPYMLDFFSIARGYGLSTGLMMASIYFIIVYAKNNKLIYLVWSYFFGILSVLTVVTLLFYFSALVGWTLLFFLVKMFRINANDKGQLKQQIGLLLVIGVSSVLLFYLLYEPVTGFKEKNFAQQQYMTNFFNRTIKTMVNSMGYYKYSETVNLTISYLIGTSFAVATVLQIYKLTKSKMSHVSSPEFILYILAISIAISTTIMHYWAGMRFLDNRFTVFIIPLALYTPVYLLNNLFQKNDTGKKISSALLYLFALLFIINTVTAGNFTHYLEWRYDAGTKWMMREIKNQHEDEPVQAIKLGIYWLYEPATNYYREVYDMDWMMKANRDGFEHKIFDYYYVRMKDTAFVELDNSIILKEYPVSESVLIKAVASE